MADKILHGVDPAKIGATPPSHTPAAPAAPRFKNPSASLTVPLEFPLEYDGKDYDALTVSRLRGIHFAVMKDLKGKHTDETVLLHCMTGAPVAVIEALDVDDYSEVLSASQGFMSQKLMDLGARVLDQSSEESTSSDAGQKS